MAPRHLQQQYNGGVSAAAGSDGLFEQCGSVMAVAWRGPHRQKHCQLMWRNDNGIIYCVSKQ